MIYLLFKTFRVKNQILFVLAFSLILMSNFSFHVLRRLRPRNFRFYGKYIFMDFNNRAWPIFIKNIKKHRMFEKDKYFNPISIYSALLAIYLITSLPLTFEYIHHLPIETSEQLYSPLVLFTSTILYLSTLYFIFIVLFSPLVPLRKLSIFLLIDIWISFTLIVLIGPTITLLNLTLFRKSNFEI